MIVLAAERVLVTYGIEGLTPSRVAAVSGFSRTTLYEYFKSRDDLLLAVERKSWNDVVDHLQKARPLDDVDAATMDERIGDFVAAAGERLRRAAISPSEGESLRIRHEMACRFADVLVATGSPPGLHNMVCAHAVAAVAVAAHHAFPEALDDGSLARELASLCHAYLGSKQITRESRVRAAM
jgi:AcrR family transcriptional regulator